MKNFFILVLPLLISCSQNKNIKTGSQPERLVAVKPFVVTDSVKYDSDDPAIWINPSDPSQSLIIGTDKGGDNGEGALFVFNLNGKILEDKTIRNIKRPNNVDVAYGLMLNSTLIDIAVCTERNTNSIRVFKIPEMVPVDNGGIQVFENDSMRLPMGIGLYTDHVNKKIYAIVGRKSGPMDGTYLWQYELDGGSQGVVTGKLVRKFGAYSGKNEIESIAVDNELGYVYYSDEGVGIRKYYAHPDSANHELAIFGTTGFTDNHEGISIYKLHDGVGYILVSDQQANKFHIFPREGTQDNPHNHPNIKTITTSTIASDGSEITSVALPGFPHGLFVAMSDDKTFQFYRWEDLAGDDLHSFNSSGN
jgi:3-phytase